MQAADHSSALSGMFDGLTGVPRVAVAVSGGSDSMALLRLVDEWAHTQHGPRDVFALTVDHGLRTASAGEAAQVGRWCAALELAHVTLLWEGEKPTTGIQAKARQVRYDLLAQWCRKNAVSVLMTGHTADDQAETVFMRQQRTSSAKSLAGIWPENEWLGVKISRPLLAVKRQTLKNYLQDLGQAWLEDPSNDDTRFERVRVRQFLAGHSTEELQSLAISSQHSVREMEAQAKMWRAVHQLTDCYGVMRLSRTALMRERSLLRHFIVGHAVQTAGDGALPHPTGVVSVANWIQDGETGRRSLNGAIVNARQHVIEVMREPARIRDRWHNVPDTGVLTFDGRFNVTAPAGSFVGPMGLPPLLKRFKDVPAFAFSALPAVKLADGNVISAVKSTVNGISATLCERFTM